MAERKPETTEQPGRRSEVFGIVFIGIGLIFALSLFSYNPSDPAWGAASTGGDVGNLAGRFGSYLSDALFQLLGGAAFLLPFYLVVYGVNRMLDKVRGHKVLKVAGGLILLVSVSTLLRLMYVHLPFRGIQAGGLIGELIGIKLLDIFGSLGAYTLTITVLLCGLVISTTFSLLGGMRAGQGVAYIIYDKARTLFIMHTERKRKAKVKEERAEAPPEPPPAIVEPEEAEEHPPAVSIQEPLPFQGEAKTYVLPPISLLSEPQASRKKTSRESLLVNANMLEKRIRDFGVEGKVTQVHPGPVVTMYEFEPAPGVKVGKIANLSDDISLAMRAESVRIVAPLPGKAAVGIEIPNNVREEVCMKEILASPEFQKSRSPLALALGKDIYGAPVVTDLARMPHLLVAGATGSGKSVAINTMTMSLLMNAKPRDLRLIMVDPKRLELSMYEGIPHLLDQVITEPRRAAAALRRLVVVMEERYKLLAEKGVRNIESYNAKQVKEKAHPRLRQDTGEDEVPREAIPNDDGTLPYIVVIIDELADLMMVAAKEIEDSIARLAQMARASGIHLLMATQRPSVDVLTGVIKANFPARMSFQVSSKTDSRTILDSNGAEALLGKGDMLFLPPGTSKIVRIHGSYVSEDEINRVVNHLKAQARPRFDLFTSIAPPAYEPKKSGGGSASYEDGSDDGRDERYHKAVELCVTAGKASASFLQRRMRIGYPTASRIIEMMEDDGIVGPKKEGGKEREVLRKPEGR